MDDRSGTVETYERVADRYRERHADRDVVADLVERFLDALGVGDGDVRRGRVYGGRRGPRALLSRGRPRAGP